MTGAAQSNVPPTLSIIVPTYRDGPRIHQNLVRLDRALAPIGEPYEIIVVSDGNVDNTEEEARRLDAPHVRVYHYARNMGKGFALRYGVARSCGAIVTFIDGDGDIDPTQIASYLHIMRETRADVVVGSKRHPDSQVVYPPLRRLYSATYQALLRVLFRLNVHDTQVGLKLFRREVLVAVLPRIVVKRYAFDLELLVVAHHLGFTRVIEAPVHIGERFSTTINREAIKSILQETVAIFYRKHVLHYYDLRQVVIPFDALSTTTDAELLVSTTEEQRIAHNVLLWLADGCDRITGRCYTRCRARLRYALNSRMDSAADEVEETGWRAGMSGHG